MLGIPRRRPTFVRAARLAFVSALVPVAAQSAQTRAAVGEVLLVDFRAVTTDGQPVLDLKPSDVELKVGGRTRTLKSLELVQLPADAASGAPAVVSPLPAPFATNASSAVVAGPGREFVLLFEDESILPGASSR